MALLIGSEATGANATTVAKKLTAAFYEALASGKVSELHCKPGAAQTWTGGAGVWAAIYADEEYEPGLHRPGSLLGKGLKEGQAFATGEVQHVTLTSEVTLVKGTRYWIVFFAVGTALKFMHTSTGAAASRKSTKSNYVEPPASTTEWEAAVEDIPVSFWGTGTESGEEIKTGTGSVTGGGLLGAKAAGERIGSGAVRGGGLVSGVGIKVAVSIGGVRGGGLLSATSTGVRLASAAVRGGGLVSGTHTAAGEVKTGSGLVRGGGFVTSFYRRVSLASGAVRGGGLVSAAGLREGVSIGVVHGGGLVTGTHRRVALARGSVTGGGRVTGLGAIAGAGFTGRVRGGGSISATFVAVTITPEPGRPPIEGHVAVGQVGRIGRSMGRLSTGNKGRAER